MNEEETNLIREYVHIDYLIKHAAKEMDNLKSSRYSMISMLQHCVRGIGHNLTNRHKQIKRELYKMRINVWIEDNGEEVVFICTSKNGVKGKHGMKRTILYGDSDYSVESPLM